MAAESVNQIYCKALSRFPIAEFFVSRGLKQDKKKFVSQQLEPPEADHDDITSGSAFVFYESLL
jgi:hypothetical protein